MFYKRILPILNTVFLAVIAMSFMLIADSAISYSAPERIITIVERTKEVFSFSLQQEVDVEKSQMSQGFDEELNKDYACYSKIVNNEGILEYGYLISGDVINRLSTVDGWTYVEFSDQANVRHSNECWIWI